MRGRHAEGPGRWSIRRFFVPHYPELTVFLMAIALALFVAANGPLVVDQFVSLFVAGKVSRVVVMVVAGVGGIVALFHGLALRRKSRSARRLMLFFAIWLSVLASISSAEHLFAERSGPLLVAPILNLVQAVWLMLLLRFDIVGPDDVSSENASRRDALLGALVVLAVLAVTQFGLALHASLVLSFTVSTATGIGAMIGDRGPEPPAPVFRVVEG